jgi:hypothetical protein
MDEMRGVSDLEPNVVCLQYLPDCDDQVVILCTELRTWERGKISRFLKIVLQHIIVAQSCMNLWRWSKINGHTKHSYKSCNSWCNMAVMMCLQEAVAAEGMLLELRIEWKLLLSLRLVCQTLEFSFFPGSARKWAVGTIHFTRNFLLSSPLVFC